MSKRTLLLADDSVTIQKVVNLTFADEGINVVTVGDGDSAMEKISEISPDIILVDVHMPGLNGYQICEIVRENPVTKNLPVVLLVGSFEPFDENEAARVGASAYLTKPFQSIRQLVSQVTDLMEAAGRRPEPTVEQEGPVVEDRPEEESFDKAPDTNDIDSLIQQSFSEPGAGEADAASTAPRYVDAGMDDEMIETSVVDREEEPLASEAGFGENSEGAYAASASASAPAEREELSHDATAFDSFADDREETAVLAEQAGDETSEFDEFSRTEQIPALDLPSTERAFGLDEIELLELPPIENGKTLEFTTTQRSMAELGGKQVVSLSPELMDIIVQKVVEKLSEKY